MSSIQAFPFPGFYEEKDGDGNVRRAPACPQCGQPGDREGVCPECEEWLNREDRSLNYHSDWDDYLKDIAEDLREEIRQEREYQEEIKWDTIVEDAPPREEADISL